MLRAARCVRLWRRARRTALERRAHRSARGKCARTVLGRDGLVGWRQARSGRHALQMTERTCGATAVRSARSVWQVSALDATHADVTAYREAVEGAAASSIALDGLRELWRLAARKPPILPAGKSQSYRMALAEPRRYRTHANLDSVLAGGRADLPLWGRMRA